MRRRREEAFGENEKRHCRVDGSSYSRRHFESQRVGVLGRDWGYLSLVSRVDICYDRVGLVLFSRWLNENRTQRVVYYSDRMK